MNESKLNQNQITALKSLNRQVADYNINNVEPVEICEPVSDSKQVVDTNIHQEALNTHSTPNSGDISNPAPTYAENSANSVNHLKIHKTDVTGISNPDQLHDIIINQVSEIDFLSYIDEMGGNRNKYIREDKTRIPAAIVAVVVCDYAIKIIDRVGYAICQLCDGDSEIKSAYLFNGKYWLNITDRWIKNLLRDMLLKMGYDPLEARTFAIGIALINSFWDFIPASPSKDNNNVLINLKNCTLHIMPSGEIRQQKFNPADFLMYSLDYDYSSNPACPLFTKYLNRVLPDKQSQNVLQELIGSIFIKNINLEKIGILLGSGANGKSVLLKIISAMLGNQNISQMDLKSLTTDRNADNNRSHLFGKLLNFAPEINARGEQAHDLIKRMASGEAITAKLMYKDTFVMTDYAKLIFNANTLPTDVEHTHGFFRRFLIVHFNQTISDQEKDPELAAKIIASELPAVLNWVIEGTKRLQKNKEFSDCEKSSEMLADYQLSSDIVALWIDEHCYIPHETITKALKDLYTEFASYATQCGHKKIPIDRTLAKRLEFLGFKKRRGKPLAFFMVKDSSKV